MDNVKKDYDDEPVTYCGRCLSLNIQEVPVCPGKYYCCECGTLELREAKSIEDWKSMFKEKYGHDFVVKEKKRPWPWWC